MKTTKKLSTIIVLSIFVLCHILPLHNAISHCVDANVYKTVEDLDQLYKDRFEVYRNAKKKLDEAENTDRAEFVRNYIITHTAIGMGTAAIGSTLTAGITLLPAVGIGYITGIATGTATGTIAYYKAISDAKKALKTAETELEHAKAKLDKAKERQSRETIRPRESIITVYQPHNIDISTKAENIPIARVEAYFAPNDLIDKSVTETITVDTGYFSNNVYETTLSYTFSTKQKGYHSGWVTVYLTNGKEIKRHYIIHVTD